MAVFDGRTVVRLFEFCIDIHAVDKYFVEFTFDGFHKPPDEVEHCLIYESGEYYTVEHMLLQSIEASQETTIAEYLATNTSL